VCAATAVVSTEYLPSTAAAASTMETPENTENDPDDSEPAIGDIKINHSPD
jgi:hypothetical protein